MFKIIAELDMPTKDTSVNFIYNLSVIDSGINIFLEEEGFKETIGGDKTIKMISRTLYQMGNVHLLL